MNNIIAVAEIVNLCLKVQEWRYIIASSSVGIVCETQEVEISQGN
jgi:hypothetical protein